VVTVTSRPTTSRSKARAAAGRVVRSRKVYVLKFDDPDNEGVVIRARSVPLGRFLSLLKLAAAIDDPSTVGGESALAITGLFEGFAEALVEWNLDDRLEDEIVEVPATYEGMLTQDTDFMLQVVMTWMEVIGDVDGPLGPASSSGKPSLEAGIPMQAPTSVNPSS
jgi:hypothetical protein